MGFIESGVQGSEVKEGMYGPLFSPWGSMSVDYTYPGSFEP